MGNAATLAALKDHAGKRPAAKCECEREDYVLSKMTCALCWTRGRKQRSDPPLPELEEVEAEGRVKLSKFEIVHQVALGIGRPFTKAELVVAAWKSDQESFGLKGFEGLYPDSNAVAVALYGKKGCLARGWIVACGIRRFKAVPKGARLGKKVS